jgi:primosomal protein N' (replication factor Y) (superfamily II helicase)
MKIVRVGLDVPVAGTFDYLAPDAITDDVGRRVVVPFGRRTLIGVVLELDDRSALAEHRLKSVVRVLRSETAFTRADLALLRFASDYYHHPLGQVVMHALPLRLRRREAGPPSESVYAITALGREQRVDAMPARALVRRRLLDAFQTHGALTAVATKQIAATARAAVKAFESAGWITATSFPPIVTGPVPQTAAAAPAWPLNVAQASAIAAIHNAFGRFQPFLLRGVTGSGKTEVYLHAAQMARARNEQVLMLVPEIALTPQLEAMVQARFPGTLLVSLHSGLSEIERLRNWRSAQSGEARIVLGTRLAVFASLPQLGLIVVDEEHDASFKQTEGFCYSARDLAVVRASQLKIPIVLGSATPSLETYHNAREGRYHLLELPERTNARPPRITCIALKPAHEGYSKPLLQAIEERLARGEQTLIFINRRGYAPVLMCHGCGWLSSCHRCSAQLVLHLPARELRCHHCGHRAPVPATCPDCGNADLSPLGQGTQRVEATLAQHFPAARILRIDRDSTRRKRAWNTMRERIHARDVDILVGTQILAKGHDFPHLALVGVLNADAMLYSSDFRASERLYALLTQVAGRAGRGEIPGEVLIQTEFPEHPLYTALRDQDLDAYAKALLLERRSAGFPPFMHQALLRAEATEVATALQFLKKAQTLARNLGSDVTLYDPVPAAMVRLAGRERAQLLVQSSSRRKLHVFLKAWRDALAAQKSSTARWALDIDPLEL